MRVAVKTSIYFGRLQNPTLAWIAWTVSLRDFLGFFFFIYDLIWFNFLLGQYNSSFKCGQGENYPFALVNSNASGKAILSI